MSLAPVGQIAPQPWMTDPRTRRVIAALTADGADVRFVGGCVRDAVLKRPIRDIDIATHDPPERVVELLERAGVHAIPTGIAHGTVTAVVEAAHFEITTLRRDVETFGRHARVEFTDDWAADAARRDFTINAMFLTPDGWIYDPFEGLQDLGAGCIRFVGDARERIREDVLRLLRFFRFYAYYGRPPVDRDALAACRAMAPALPTLSGERVSGEMLRLLAAPDPASVLRLMYGERILEHVLPEAGDFGRLRQLAWLESRGLRREGLHPDALRRLAAVLETDADGAAAVAARLRLSNRQTERLVTLAAPAAAPAPHMDRRQRRRLLRRLGAEGFRDLVLLGWAGDRASAPRDGPWTSEDWAALLAEADAWTPVALPVKGRDVLDLGVPPGPRVGDLLRRVEDWWEARDYRPDRAACLARLRDLAADRTPDTGNC